MGGIRAKYWPNPIPGCNLWHGETATGMAKRI